MKTQHRTKYIFVTGGVVSSLGKGIVAASLASLLENRGLRVMLTKVDPYINVDPGTMNPFQHGEVFVTEDGAETDLDIGHYERFTHALLTKRNSFSTGQVYDSVLTKERKGDYLGGTVQVIPHVTNQIKSNIHTASEGADISIIEIGGTVGDIESQPYMESIRQLQYEMGRENCICIHLTLVPYIKAAHELKTKPTQHSVKELRQMGVMPDIICCRADRSVPRDVRDKIASTCNVEKDCVIEVPDADSIYKVPLKLHEQKLDQIVIDRLNIWAKSPDLSDWKKIEDALDHPQHKVKIGVIGKYTEVVDSYKSISEALVHAGISNHAAVEISLIEADTVEKGEGLKELSNLSGAIIPGGFGNRGIEGKIQAIKFLRENNIPTLGICLGMQLTAVEFARNKLGLSDADSQEFNPKSQNQIIHLMEEQKAVMDLGGTMRLGAFPCTIKRGTKAYESYEAADVSERHRHRFEFNNKYREIFEQNGVVFSGTSPDDTLVEMMELSDHPWFVAVQFHPELKSSPRKSHPLFRNLVKAALTRGV